MNELSWAYGLTTCADRAGDQNLRRTLDSLARGGFPGVGIA